MIFSSRALRCSDVLSQILEHFANSDNIYLLNDFLEFLKMKIELDNNFLYDCVANN